jgi:TolB protein
VTPVGPSTEPAPPGSIICSNCGMANDPTRVYCSRCATELAAVTAPVTPIAAAPPSGGGIPPIAIAGAIGGVVVLAVLAFVFLQPKSQPATGIDSNNPSIPDATSSPSAAASAVASAGPSASVAPSASASAAPSTAPPTPSGTLVFSVVTNGTANVVAWSFADDKATTLAGGNKFDQTDPAVSWSGGKVVYVNTTGASKPLGGAIGEGLRLVNTDSSAVGVPDFTHHDVDRNPAWSPNDKTIAFASTRLHADNKNLDIYSRPLNDTTVTNLLVDNAADDWDPAYAADGNTIVFVSKRNGDAKLFTMDKNGKGEKILDLGDGIFDDPTYSPDGTSLAFTLRASSNERKQLFVADADGSNMRQIGSFDTDVNDPAWSPDSTMLAVAPGGTGAKIVIVDAATGDEIATLDSVDGTAKTPSWGP